MFAVTVETEFCAAHALMFRGEREPVHGHNFHVWATIEGPSLDQDGVLCDFHEVETTLLTIVGPFKNNDLGQTAPFRDRNPSAENIARYIADELSSRLRASLPPGARVSSVRITEAPNCTATYVPD